MNQKKIAIAGISAAMLVGAGTGLALGLPTGAGASGSNTTVTDPTDPTATADTTVTTDGTTDGTTDSTTDAPALSPDFDGDHAGPRQFLTSALADLVTAGSITQEQSDAIVAALEAAKPTDGGPRGGGLKSALADLVTAGTITQEQSDAIVTAIQANWTDGGMGGHGGFGPGGFGPGGMGGHGGFGGGQLLETAATAIGITADELKTELEAGKSIADVATAKGVDVQTVIDAIVAEQTANITERVADMVNGVRPTMPADADADDTPATTDDTTVTTGG
jgi:hypothetical protein